MNTLSDKVVIVTGASSGIGGATALALAQRGAKVVVAARRLDRLESLCAKVREAGGRALAVECDVANRDSARAMVRRAQEEFGRVDGLVNNAGVMPLSRVEDLREDDWQRMVDVNIMGVLHCTAAALPGMVQRDSGHIVNVSSVAGRRVFPAGAVYCGTKHFVHAFSEGLRGEMTGKNIRVTIVAPGLVRTELQEGIPVEAIREGLYERMKKIRPLEPEDIAREIAHAMEAPAHVDVNEILVRPVDQEG